MCESVTYRKGGGGREVGGCGMAAGTREPSIREQMWESESQIRQMELGRSVTDTQQSCEWLQPKHCPVEHEAPPSDAFGHGRPPSQIDLLAASTNAQLTEKFEITLNAEIQYISTK